MDVLFSGSPPADLLPAALEQVQEAGFRLLYGYVRDPRPAEIVVDLDALLELPPTTLVFHELEALWSGDFKRSGLGWSGRALRSGLIWVRLVGVTPRLEEVEAERKTSATREIRVALT